MNTNVLVLPFLLAATAQATDFGPLMEVVRTTWPEKAHLCVVANYRHSQGEILALAREAGDGNILTVIDITHRDQIGRACNLVKHWRRPDYVVLLPRDPLVRDGSPHATQLLHQAAMVGVAAIGTTRKAVRQGAVFAIGPDTGLGVLVNDTIIGTIAPVLPPKGFTPVAARARGMAEVTVIAAFRP